jgi:alanine dehydrogenase
MRIGVPKEVKDHEDRVGLVPSSVAELVHHGHEVIVEAGAGVGSGLTDAEYAAAGATLHDSLESVFALADMIVKVKEPLPAERKRLRPGQILFTYLHLAADLELTRELLSSGATCIAYETVTSPTGTLPLLTPMSEVAGRLAPQAGAHHLERAQGGRGVLLGGVPGVPAAEVVILGGGVSGCKCHCRGPFGGGATKDCRAVRFSGSYDLLDARCYSTDCQTCGSANWCGPCPRRCRSEARDG